MRFFQEDNIAAAMGTMNHALRADRWNVAVVAEIRNLLFRVLLAVLADLTVRLVDDGVVLGSLCAARPTLRLHASSRLLCLKLLVLLMHGWPHPREV